MVIKLLKRMSSGNDLPITIQIARLTRERMLSYQITSENSRNQWCSLSGKTCPKYGCRPCCPPNVKMFNKMAPHRYMYLVQVKITLEDYLEYSSGHPKNTNTKFLFMSLTHKITRNISNRIVGSFDGQVFKVGGCLGCTYSKDGKCKRFAPALEGTGIDLAAISRGVFSTDLDWSTPNNEMLSMTAIGGIYTDELISKENLKGVVKDACGR